MFFPNTEILFPPLDEDEGTEGPMIIEAEIGGHCIHRMYVDGGSASEILCEQCFNRLRLEIKTIEPATNQPLIRFSGEIIWPIGQIQLLVRIGDEEHSALAWMNFVVIRSSSLYNGIIERPGVMKLQAIALTAYEMLKLPVEGGVITLKSSRLVPLECALVFGPEETLSDTKPIVEERVKRNLDIFAWKPADMTDVPRHIAEHRLNVREGCSPVRKKKRGQAADRNQAIQEEVGKLMEAGIMKEVHYHDWLSNPVMRLVDKAFHKQIGRNLEVYVDDLVIKSRTENEIVRDIEETFKTLWEINMKLNPKKCTFGVEERMFLGYKVNTKGLKVCPDKKSDFHWTTEAEEAFKQMKQLITELPMLTTPMEKEELIVYLAVAKETVSAVLMTEREAKQMPIYFVSRALRGPEINYTSMEKLVLALVHASKRLKRYFQAHPIIVIMDQPIQQVLSRPEVAGRLQKWSIELGDYAIHYRPRVSVKGQILANFIVKRLEEDSPDTLMEIEEELPKLWILFMDGSSCTDGSRAGLILTKPEEIEFTYALRFRFDTTNNEAEYEALISRLRIAEQMGVKILQANVDLQLVANQVNGTYVAKQVDMTQYLEKVRTLNSNFKAFSIRQIPRSENKKADALSKIASISFAHLSKQVLVEELKEKSISEVEILAVVEEEEDTWMTLIFEFLTEETLPADVKQARAVRRKPLLANYVLREIYEGSCSMHRGTQSIIAKGLRIGYYWPTMHKDDRALIRACQDCQVHKPVPRNPQQKLTPITSPWPFYKWGIDIAGPFLEGPRKVKFLIVAMDYFTKWIKAKPFATITGEGIKARLDAGNKNWMEELSHVLWAHRTMIKFSNGDTPFSLTYGTKASLEINLDLLEELREQVAIRDLVYRNNDASRAEDIKKLGPKWQGPYKVIEALRKGAYKLRDRDGKQLPWTWNVNNLKKCYIQKM
ncbi:reverse transcriptase domain-containing protein [Tanacetum coccineum]